MSETTTVTTSVVFTDLVGSTELSASLSPSAAEQVRATHFRLLRDAVAATGGTEVKNLGDGLMVVYPSLKGALDGAVAMQQGVELHNRKAAHHLGLRVGVSSGDATAENGDYFGEPIVEASRLCAQARGGQILTTDMVQVLARRTAHAFESVGALALKGMPEPVEACEVLWERGAAVTLVGLPSRLTATPPMGVIGRALEDEQLLTLQKGAFTGGGHRIALLSGEPGIGKTTLAANLAQRAHGEGATVLYGRCDEDIGVPYQPFVEALASVLAEAPESVLRSLTQRHLSELTRLVPQARQHLPWLAEPASTDADAERYLLFAAVTASLTELAAEAPIMLVLDDLHWADKPTVLLLRHLVATLDNAQVLIVGTYRDTDLTAAHPLTEGLAALRRETSVQRVALDGLDDYGVLALLEGLAGEMDGDGPALAQAVRRETDGNPFFTAEVLRHLIETGAIRSQGGRWVAAVELSAIGLPESVREVVGERVRRLGPDVHAILAGASVIGRDFELPLVAKVTERSEDDVLDALELAVASQIVAETGGGGERFTFAHALFQRTLYDELSPSRRASTHRRIGELLEFELGANPGDRVAELAHHWIAATLPVDSGKAAGYAYQAGERARAALAPDEAIRWFRQAVEIVDAMEDGDQLQRLDALIGLGDAQRDAGDAGYRETLLDAADRAIALGDTDRLVAAVLANQRGMVSGMGSVDDDRIVRLERAVAAVPEIDSPKRAMLLAVLSSELSFSDDAQRVQALALEAEAMARRIGDDAALLRVLNLTFLPLWWPEFVERTLSATQEALDLAVHVGDRVARFWSAMHRSIAMATVVDAEALDEALALADAMAAEIGLPYPKIMVLQARCAQVLMKGDAEEADRLGMEALQIGMETGQPDAMMMFGANFLSVRFHQGRLEEVLPLLSQAAADNPGLPGFVAAMAAMYCECGRLDEARTLLSEARAADFHRLNSGSISPTTTAFWADTAVLLGDTVAAQELLDRLLPFADQGVAAGGTFSGTIAMYAARLAGLLGRDAEALQLFEQADAQIRAMGAPFWQARNQVEWARLLLEDGVTHAGRARELLLEAKALATEFGCAGVERRADALLALVM